MLATISVMDILGRLAIAMLVGGVVGIERELRGRSAGLRTTMLACVAAAAAVLMAEKIFGELTGSGRDAASRIMQGILTGIGFLGAGAINREGRRVHGLTSAAVLWMLTILGMGIGAGQWVFALLGLGMTLLILVVLRSLESHLHPDCFAVMVITVQMSGISDTEIKQKIEAAHAHVKHVSLHHDVEAKQRTIRCDVRYHKSHLFRAAEQVVNDLSQSRGVLSVEWTHG